MKGSEDRAIVIGGGVIGAACAHFLNRFGWHVTIIDADEFGQGCSHGNCGLVCASHVRPLTEPGAFREGLKSLLKKSSPFHIKPRLDPRLWSWLWRFARRCNQRDMMEAARARHALLQSSSALYHELLDDGAVECEWETRGLLYVFRTRSELEKYAETERLLRDHFGLAATCHAGDEVVEREPALKRGLAGGWYYEVDCHLRPDKLLASWRSLLEERGVSVLEHCELKAFRRRNSRAWAIDTSTGEMAADAFVVATGALTPLLARQLGCRIPIQPGKGYSITMPRPGRCPALPMIFPEDRVAVTPMRSAYRLGSTMEFAGYDRSIDSRRIALLKEGARLYLQEPYCDPVEQQWYGWRPMTYDGIPIIDRCPIMQNVCIAAGHNMIGVSAAPATGRLVAELLSGRSVHIDPRPYSALRF